MVTSPGHKVRRQANHLPSYFLIIFSSSPPFIISLSARQSSHALSCPLSEPLPLRKPHGHSDDGPRLPAFPRPPEHTDHLLLTGTASHQQAFPRELKTMDLGPGASALPPPLRTWAPRTRQVSEASPTCAVPFLECSPALAPSLPSPTPLTHPPCLRRLVNSY